MRSPFSSPRHRRSALVLALLTAASPGLARAFVWPNVPEQVARALSGGDVTERRLAATRLSELPLEIALRLVQQAMGDPDVEVRLRASQAAITLRVPKAGDQVMPWLSEGDARLRLAACDVIRAAPTDRSVVALGRVLGDPDPHVRLAAAAAMGSSGMTEAVSPLLGHLDDTSPEVREEVARALGRIGDGRAVVPLIGKVQDSVADVRKVVARALGELGDLRAQSALMLALQDASSEVRLEAVGALGKLRSDEATAAIAPLVEASDVPDAQSLYTGRAPTLTGVGAPEVRAAAVRALGRIGSDAAVKVLVSALVKDDISAQRSPVRDALTAAGKPAVKVLVATLSGSPPASTAAGAALVLGALHAEEGEGPIIRAMQRGVVPLRPGLRALAQIGSRSALPTVLEMLDDGDPTTRKEAIRAAIALLDPADVDGRPVDPASAALRDSATPIDEKIELIRLLGATGAPRAKDVLLPLASAKPTALRLAVLEALGGLRSSSKAVDDALLKALDDEAAEVRLKAAIALSRVGSPPIAKDLLVRLAVAAEQDRGAIGIAISGALARSTDAALVGAVREAIATAPDIARDALVEGLGRMRAREAGRALGDLSKGGIDDRRKVAEALAGHPEMEEALRKLAADPDAGVRANAAWSLGAAGTKGSIAVLARLVTDPDVAVAGDAAAAIGRIAGRENDSSLGAPALCGALAEPRPYVRANAVEGLSIASASCESGAIAGLLARDPSEAVRLAAADYLSRALLRAGDKGSPLESRALTRCASEDHNASVALRCARPAPSLAMARRANLQASSGSQAGSQASSGSQAGSQASSGSQAGSQASPSASVRTEDVAVYVVPDGRSTPQPRAPFALVRADGLLRLGLADRRGEIFEFAAPPGSIHLAVPAALAR